MTGPIITEVDGERCAAEINSFNGLFPDAFEALKPRHLRDGYWWLVHDAGRVVGFAGMVPFEPFPKVGYLKRAAILADYRGHGLQGKLMGLREERARSLTNWTCLISECAVGNVASANNFIRAGYRLVEVERPWEKDTLFWKKELRT